MGTPLINACKAFVEEREAEELRLDVDQNIEDLYDTLERVHYGLCDLEALLQRRVFGEDEASKESRKKYWRPSVSEGRGA
ncbi:MAG: hypothetical protein ACYDHY_14435 [Acidiferrobacterales bacterium]